MPEIYTRIDFSDVERLKKRLQMEVNAVGGNGPLRQALRTIGLVYLSEMQDRWLKLAKGGGAWKSLAEATVDRRRARKRYKWTLRSILFETGTLFNSLNPIWGSVPGGLRRDIPGGVDVGFSGNASHILPPHPIISELARIQQTTRPILVEPSPRFYSRAQEILDRSCSRLIEP